MAYPINTDIKYIDEMKELLEACQPYLKRKKMTKRSDCERLNKAYKRLKELFDADNQTD